MANNEIKTSVFMLHILVVVTELGFDARGRNPFEGASNELFLGV